MRWAAGDCGGRAALCRDAGDDAEAAGVWPGGTSGRSPLAKRGHCTRYAGCERVRHRVFNADLGRWTRRDPLGYVEGMSLYAYTQGQPIIHGDPTGQSRHPLSGWCRKWIPDPNHQPNPNGCSNPVPGYGGWNDFFKSCCDEHDACYQTCNSDRKNCDAIWYTCMIQRCIGQRRLRTCLAFATKYFEAVRWFGCGAWKKGQRAACKCIERRPVRPLPPPHRRQPKMGVDVDQSGDSFIPCR